MLEVRRGWPGACRGEGRNHVYVRKAMTCGPRGSPTKGFGEAKAEFKGRSGSTQPSHGLSDRQGSRGVGGPVSGQGNCIGKDAELTGLLGVAGTLPAA